MEIKAKVTERGDSVGRGWRVQMIQLSAVTQEIVTNPQKFYGPTCTRWHFYQEGVCYEQTDLPLGATGNTGRGGQGFPVTLE